MTGENDRNGLVGRLGIKTREA